MTPEAEEPAFAITLLHAGGGAPHRVFASRTMYCSLAEESS